MGKKIIEVKDKVEFGKTIREERDKQKLTQAHVAQMAGLDDNYYAMVERGEKNISLEKMLKILQALKMEVILSGL